MVNLPSSSQEVNFHTGNFRLRRNHRDPEPKTLLQLEALANRCALIMSKYEESPHHRETALKLLRQQYNLEFKLQCHKCKTAHQQDELYACAPESQEVNFHTWNFRLRRNRRVVYEDPEPKTLLQLEALANRCALMMSKYEESPHHRETALKLLRQQYNLEFKLQCHKCKTAHQQDELYACAPER